MFKHKFTFRQFLATSLLCTLLISCQKEDLNQDDINHGEETLSKDAKATLDYLVEKGYSREDLKADFKDEAFVHGDYVIPFSLKSNMDKNPPEKGSIQEKNQWYYIGNGVYYSNSRDIKYYIESSVPSNLINPIIWAAYHWYWSSSNISIGRTFNRYEADIIIGTWYNPNEVAWARAALPDGRGNVGSWMRINTAKNHGNNASTMALYIHEFGHNLGFLHSDQYDGGQIPGTNGVSYHQRNNCGSVMKSSVYTCNWRMSTTPGWTYDDRTAIRWAYGY